MFPAAALFLLLVPPASAAEVGPSAVWEPLMGVSGEFRDECQVKAAPDAGACLLSFMEKAGASAQARAFSASLGGEGWVRRFAEEGRVDAAFVHYPFRANANEGLLLVNGRPESVDVSSSAWLGPLARDPRLAAVRAAHPDAALWGDDPGRPLVAPRPGGGQRFLFDFPVRTCHACAELATARVAYDFDGDGNFLIARLLTVSGPPVFAVEGTVERGKTFEAPIDSTRTFRLNPFSEGWVIEVRDGSGNDDCMPVTPPYHGVNAREIFGWHFRDADDTGPNEAGAKRVDAPGFVREFRCVTTPAEYDEAYRSLKAVLWSEPRSWKETDAAVQAHERVAASAQRGRLLIRRLELGNLGKGLRPWIESMSFRFELRPHGAGAR